ncbi:MAG: sigma-70 family RNA polymerase sigma factor [Bacteroidota bacterium]
MDHKTETFLALIDDNKKLIYKIVNAYCKNRALHQDLVQEIILQLWSSFDKYDSNYKASTWMYRIALNTAISYHRKGLNQPTSFSDFLQQHEDRLIWEARSELDPNLQLLNQFIQELKEMDKALILLHLDGLQHQEIAGILGISPTNVGTRLFRIKNSLRIKFQSTPKSKTND